MQPDNEKILIQCDFDGTITQEDVSFTLLENFADGNWRERLKDYQNGKITVGRFNTEAFAMVKADRETLVKHALEQVRIRYAFPQFLAYCEHSGIKLVIVSNGLDFYIEAIMRALGAPQIEFVAARTKFTPQGLDVQYIGPDGKTRLEEDFKGAYTTSFLDQGYRVMYAGNGTSDLLPAKRTSHIFATGSLEKHCKRLNIEHTPFTDFKQVMDTLEGLVSK
jgi:2-hydroxy-3-keto-5-methylthiopentenyl-1-phosphate phosphatase